jgi:hypothetical protein
MKKSAHENQLFKLEIKQFEHFKTLVDRTNAQKFAEKLFSLHHKQLKKPL